VNASGFAIRAAHINDESDPVAGEASATFFRSFFIVNGLPASAARTASDTSLLLLPFDDLDFLSPAPAAPSLLPLDSLLAAASSAFRFFLESFSFTGVTIVAGTAVGGAGVAALASVAAVVVLPFPLVAAVGGRVFFPLNSLP